MNEVLLHCRPKKRVGGKEIYFENGTSSDTFVKQTDY